MVKLDQDSKKTLFVCQNDRGENHPKGSCFRKGSGALLAHIKAQCKQNPEWNMRATSSGCLGRCNEGPVCVIFPNNIWQNIETMEEADTWISESMRSSC